MNKLFQSLLIAAVLALVALPAPAQQYGAQGTMVSAGVVVSPFTGSSYTSNYSAVGLTKFDDAFIYLTCSPSNTSSGQIKVFWTQGPDGSSFANVGSTVTNYVTLEVGTAGTLVNWGTNITLGAAGYLKTGIVGATNSTLTNVTFKVYTKPKRNG